MQGAEPPARRMRKRAPAPCKGRGGCGAGWGAEPPLLSSSTWGEACIVTQDKKKPPKIRFLWSLWPGWQGTPMGTGTQGWGMAHPAGCGVAGGAKGQHGDPSPCGMVAPAYWGGWLGWGGSWVALWPPMVTPLTACSVNMTTHRGSTATPGDPSATSINTATPRATTTTHSDTVGHPQ